MKNMPSRKQPRDFVHIDEFWDADRHWVNYFFQQKIWVYVDEYRAELTGDEDYSRIVIHAGEDQGWLFSRPLSKRNVVHDILCNIFTPVSEQQLETLGFVRWTDHYI
ncbi:MAG: hypothetical protein ACI92E_002668 [Oceanicoccus sp.]|jgi:hypothetical protein